MKQASERYAVTQPALGLCLVGTEFLLLARYDGSRRSVVGDLPGDRRPIAFLVMTALGPTKMPRRTVPFKGEDANCAVEPLLLTVFDWGLNGHGLHRLRDRPP